MKPQQMIDSTPTEVQIPHTMIRQAGTSHPGALPVKSDLMFSYVFSIICAILMTTVSLGGLLVPTFFYPTIELIQTFVPNDVVNLLLGLPILLGSMWLTRHGKLIGLLFWPGALWYIVYNYIAFH